MPQSAGAGIFRNRRRSLLDSSGRGFCCGAGMFEGYWVVILIVGGIVVYVGAKVVFYMRKSRQQWLEVDRSKLREWEDDEDR